MRIETGGSGCRHGDGQLSRNPETSTDSPQRGSDSPTMQRGCRYRIFLRRGGRSAKGTHDCQATKVLGLGLRHFPQSFEFSTLGGWIATRSGGHYATLYTHVEDFVESLRTVTPAGVIESRRLPGSGAGSSPDRFIVGLEGSIGIITEAWMRLQDRPKYRASVSALVSDLFAAARLELILTRARMFTSTVLGTGTTSALP